MNRTGFHIVKRSWWPVMTSLFMYGVIKNLLGWAQGDYDAVSFCLLSLSGVGTCLVGWWWDVIMEGVWKGNHTSLVARGLRLGVIYFIISETFLFFSFFWAYFHFFFGSSSGGFEWPPVGVVPVNPYGLPLLNTVILLTSGFSVTWAYLGLVEKHNLSEFIEGMVMSIMLGVYFLFFQYLEYSETSFCISDSVYGSVFFIATGFHGLHVLIGVIMLVVSFFRGLIKHFSFMRSYVGLDAAVWYWHFVDVVWIFLFIFVYWWGC